MGGLIFVGLGLAGLQDLTLRGLDAIRSADVVLAEFYTSRVTDASLADLEGLFGKKVRLLSREDVEAHGDEIVREAKSKVVAFVVAGDPMTATTHHDLLRRAEEERIPTRVIPGISIFTAAPGAAGLQIYKFGRTTTLAFPEGKYVAESPYEVIRENRARGLHTLVLLDSQADKDRFMRAPEAVELLRAIEERRKENVVLPDTLLVGLARVGAPDARVVVAPASEWHSIDLGPPLHTLIVPGTLHFMEEEALARRRNGSPRSV
ncbi:MAG: diphthine synthase [Euryarchaeota archaeon]|nr:diphthine synthase [Euryarchaeota archaeon]